MARSTRLLLASLLALTSLSCEAPPEAPATRDFAVPIQADMFSNGRSPDASQPVDAQPPIDAMVLDGSSPPDAAPDAGDARVDAAVCADETCDGVDNDCDNITDEGVLNACGDCGELPPDFCDGVDNDCDGRTDEDFVGGEIDCGEGLCAGRGVQVCEDGEVVDGCMAVEPIGPDDDCDGLDQDCDGLADEHYTASESRCGRGGCERVGRLNCQDGQLVDSCQPGEPAFDDATCDGRDDDCDERADEDFMPRESRCGVGQCASMGQIACVDGVEADSCVVGAPGIDDQCNAQDEDCDGRFDEAVPEQPSECGVGACLSEGQVSCVDGQLRDSCTPLPPQPDDASCNGLDDDCDGEADEDFQAGPTQCGQGQCLAQGERRCEDGREISDCEPGQPAADDVACDGRDADCDGRVDEDFAPSALECGAGACQRPGQRVCEGGVEQDRCTPGEPLGEDLTCDGVDDDCDGRLDEGFEPSVTACGVGACVAAGVTSCEDGVLLDSCEPLDPGVNDAVCDGLDTDCDGRLDEDFASEATACGVGACESAGRLECQGGAVVDTCREGCCGATGRELRRC